MVRQLTVILCPHSCCLLSCIFLHPAFCACHPGEAVAKNSHLPYTLVSARIEHRVDVAIDIAIWSLARETAGSGIPLVVDVISQDMSSS